MHWATLISLPLSRAAECIPKTHGCHLHLPSCRRRTQGQFLSNSTAVHVVAICGLPRRLGHSSPMEIGTKNHCFRPPVILLTQGVSGKTHYDGIMWSMLLLRMTYTMISKTTIRLTRSTNQISVTHKRPSRRGYAAAEPPFKRNGLFVCFWCRASTETLQGRRGRSPNGHPIGHRRDRHLERARKAENCPGRLGSGFGYRMLKAWTDCIHSIAC